MGVLDMNRIEQTTIGIDLLKCSDSFESRLGKVHVAKLAESIRDTGLIHPPVVRATDFEVIAGEDRVAAHVLLNRDEVLVDLVECTDEEVEAIRAAENGHRRPHTADEVAALVAKLEAEKEAVEEVETWVANEADDFANGLTDRGPQSGVDDEPITTEEAWEHVEEFGVGGNGPAKPGRPPTTHGTAVIEAAEKLEVSPSTVYKKLRDAARSGPPFETWGREANPKVVARAAESYRAITTICDILRKAHTKALRADKWGTLNAAIACDMESEIKAMIETLELKRPIALCPDCFAQDDDCHICNGLGYVGSDQAMKPVDTAGGDKVDIF